MSNSEDRKKIIKLMKKVHDENNALKKIADIFLNKSFDKECKNIKPSNKHNLNEK